MTEMEGESMGTKQVGYRAGGERLKKCLYNGCWNRQPAISATQGKETFFFFCIFCPSGLCLSPFFHSLAQTIKKQLYLDSITVVLDQWFSAGGNLSPEDI